MRQEVAAAEIPTYRAAPTPVGVGREFGPILVPGSILVSGTNILAFIVYILRGDSGRHYIGQTSDLAARLTQHRGGHTHTTQRLGGDLELIAYRALNTREEALAVERMLKAWKRPRKAIDYLRQSNSQ
ncbi:MAG TPA: GIY-YIG nuclease family protein [Lacunisphaera sp.]|nr:GIY-YIG nuclease family protein [Lacunisphaera sp.]